MEKGRKAYPKIIEASHNPRVLQDKSTRDDLYLTRGEVLTEAGNYPLAVKDVEANIVLKRAGPKGSRSLAKELPQLREAQAYTSDIIESNKLGSSQSIKRGVAGVGTRAKHVRNVVTEQRDIPKKKS